MELRLFDEVAELVTSMAPEGLGHLRVRAHRRGVKIWFGPEKPIKEHYEAQFIPRRYVDDLDGTALEIGFHAEHPSAAANDEALTALLAKKKVWAKELGKGAESGPFLGNGDWRRLSDVWLDADPEDPELAFEIASRLVDYLDLLEPIRQSR